MIRTSALAPRCCFVALPLVLVGCAYAPPGAAEAPPPANATPMTRAEGNPGAVTEALPVKGSTGGAPGAGDEGPAPPKDGTMLDIEARLNLEVDRVSEAGERLRALTRDYRGIVVENHLSGSDKEGTEELTIRVPSTGADAFLHAVEALGKLRSRAVNARDVGKDFYDAQLQLRNLDAAMKRYEQILTLAKDVKEIMLVEAELKRIRGEIEQVKGTLRYLSDRVARATVHVSLSAAHHAFPGLRIGGLYDLRGGGKDAGYLGFGISFRFHRAFSVDIDGYRKPEGGSGGLDAFLLTVGGEGYSEFFGGGNRTWLNPYIGVRGGWSHMLGKDEMALGGTVGVELFKAPMFYIDAQFRSYAFFANTTVTPHAVLQPTLAVHLSF